MIELEKLSPVLDEDEWKKITAYVCYFLDRQGVFDLLYSDDACVTFSKLFFEVISDESLLKKILKATEGVQTDDP